MGSYVYSFAHSSYLEIPPALLCDGISFFFFPSVRKKGIFTPSFVPGHWSSF